MKTTLDLPDELMREVKVQAARSNRRLKDVVAELLERGLRSSGDMDAPDPLQAWLKQLTHHADGHVINPAGIDDPVFFNSLEHIRDANRQGQPRDPFADHP